MDEAPVECRLAAILVADIAGYSRLMAEDEAATVATLKGHQAVVLPMVEAHGGRIQDTAGDGILAEFRSVLQAGKQSVAANPPYYVAFTLQASALALLGREAEAQAALAVLQQLMPGFTLARHKRGYRTMSANNPEFNRLMERYYDGLRKAGLPE